MLFQVSSLWGNSRKLNDFNRKAGWNYGLEKEKRREEARRNLLKINGRHEETRTPDLYRVKVAL